MWLLLTGIYPTLGILYSILAHHKNNLSHLILNFLSHLIDNLPPLHCIYKFLSYLTYIRMFPNLPGEGNCHLMYIGRFLVILPPNYRTSPYLSPNYMNFPYLPPKYPKFPCFDPKILKLSRISQKITLLLGKN